VQTRVALAESADKRTTRQHRAGWDATFSAPKSVSLTALVGGDGRVAEAHRASVGVALDELERYTQARLGRNIPAETTRAWVAARFEHDSARPVDGYAAPQLHTHVVVFNVTERATGDARALQPRELYKTQQLATAVYRSELARRLLALGYAVERGASGQPEIHGYSAEYLEASSPRRQQIEAHLAATQQTGARAAQIAAHCTREAKMDPDTLDMRQQHQALARRFGDQPAQVIQAALDQPRSHDHQQSSMSTSEAIRFARDRNIERDARIDERAVLRDALTRTMGRLSPAALNTASRTPPVVVSSSR
jgi:conjugative relaxase-like TrwC/TraI family protein